jgi:hypothetical protein
MDMKSRDNVVTNDDSRYIFPAVAFRSIRWCVVVCGDVELVPVTHAGRVVSKG